MGKLKTKKNSNLLVENFSITQKFQKTKFSNTNASTMFKL